MQKDSRKNEERLLPFETIKAAMEGDVDKNFAPKQNERDCPMTHIVKGEREIASKEVKSPTNPKFVQT